MRPKRLISLLVAVCMMITMLPLSAVTAFAEYTSTDPEDSYKGYKYAYTVNDGNATITKFLGPDASTKSTGSYNIEIPSELGGYPVTGLGENSFAVDSYDGYKGNPLCSNIHSVTIPQNVKSIGYRAFHGCDGLESLTFHGESIGTEAFYGCTSLTTLSLGENIKMIGFGSFQGCSSLTNVTIPQSVTSIGSYAFKSCSDLDSVTINDATTSIGNSAFNGCTSLTTLSLGKNITTIGEDAFTDCTALTEVTIPQNVTSIGLFTFLRCTSLTKLSLGNIETIGVDAFAGCSNLSTITIPDSVTDIGAGAFMFCSKLESVTIPEKVTAIKSRTFKFCSKLRTITIPDNVTNIDESAFEACSNLESITIPEKVTAIKSNTFKDCSNLKYIILPAGFTSFGDSLSGCPDDCVIYFNNDEDTADERFNSHTELAGHKLLCLLCNVTFDANGGKLNDYDGNLTDHAVVPVYKTEKITKDAVDKLTPTRAGYNFTGWYTKDGQSFDVDKTEITKNTTFYAHWDKVPVCHPLTVTGGIITVKYNGNDVTSTLNSSTDATTGQKTYSVPDGATVTVTLDKTQIPEGMVFDGWSTGEFSLPQDQNCKAETITFPMNSDADIAAEYRDAATDHTPDTTVCHPLTVTGGIVTVKNGDKDVTDTLTVTTDETTGKKTYSVPDGATVTVTLDKTQIPEGMVFDIWSTGKFSLPLDQDYKAESITFTMNTMSSDADIAAQYRDATIEDDGPNVLGTAAIIGTAAVGGAVLGYQAYSLGAEFAGKLMALPYFPSNRSALAMMLWEDAGKPMPESELLYPDVGQEERDMDLQHAARWAMENELIPDLNDEGTAPEEMKFYPDNAVSKIDVLKAWQKAQELKNN